MQEPIQIVGCTETVDNWGNTEKFKEAETLELLKNPEEWTDDQVFWGPANERYFIDDLIGKKVSCSGETFIVEED